jgi:ABC-type molybdate transport system permease subunit
LLAALLFLPGFPLFILLLSVTGVGLLLVPFLMIGVFFAALFGKAAFLAFVGRAVLRSAGEKTMGIAVLTTLLGGIIVTILYGIWYLGFALWALTTWIGIGMVLMTILNAVKRERPKAAPAAPTPPPPAAAALKPEPAPQAGSTGTMGLSAPAASGLAGDEPGAGAAVAGFVSEPPPASQPPPKIPPIQQPEPAVMAPVSPVGYERANFGIRLAAILIDTILVGVVVGVALLQFHALVHMNGTFVGLALAHMVITVPYVVRAVTASLQGTDPELEHAARVLGASGPVAFFTVTLPLIRPGVAAGALFSFIVSFDNVPVSIFLLGAGQMTLPVKIFTAIEYGVDPSIAAISTMLIVLTGVGLAVAERWIGFHRFV